MTELPFRLVDADNHFYEPRDAFTRYLPRAQQQLAVRPVTDAEGRETLMVGERPYTFSPLYYGSVGRPGSLRERMRLIKVGGVIQDAQSVEHDVIPEYVDRDARLALMDRQGVEAAIMLPTMAPSVEHFMMDDVTQMYANLRAFNRWADESWGLAHQGRIFVPPLLSLLDLDHAVEDVEWMIARGARLVHLRPCPIGGRSIADPYYDPVWSRLNEAGMVITFHTCEAGYNAMFGTHWGEPANPNVREMSAWQWTCSYGDRPVMDTMAAMVLHNLFGRFPKLSVVSIENGSLWVDYLLNAMDKYRGMARHGHWLGGVVKEKPSTIFKRHVRVAPFHEEDIYALVDRIGVERVLFGSDYPHPEGVAEPAEFVEHIDRLEPAQQRRIMRDNLAELLRI